MFVIYTVNLMVVTSQLSRLSLLRKSKKTNVTLKVLLVTQIFFFLLSKLEKKCRKSTQLNFYISNCGFVL